MSKTIKTVIFWLVIFVSAILLWQVVRAAPQTAGDEISYSRFLSAVEAGNVDNVTIDGQHIRGWYTGGKGTFHSIGPSNPEVYLEVLRNKNIDIRFRDTQGGSLPLQLLGTWAPLLLLAALWFFMIRQMQRRRQPPPPEPGAGPIEPR